jgi:hypothetical protein
MKQHLKKETYSKVLESVATIMNSLERHDIKAIGRCREQVQVRAYR